MVKEPDWEDAKDERPVGPEPIVLVQNEQEQNQNPKETVHEAIVTFFGELHSGKWVRVACGYVFVSAVGHDGLSGQSYFPPFCSHGSKSSKSRQTSG